MSTDSVFHKSMISFIRLSIVILLLIIITFSSSLCYANTQTEYLVYISIIRHPITFYQIAFNRNPNEKEYYEYLKNDIPWVIPFGGIEGLKYTFNKTDGSGTLEYINPKTNKPKTIYLSSDSISSLSASNISESLKITLDEYYDYSKAEYVLDMLDGANWNYAADNGRLPKSIDEFNQTLGLQFRVGKTYEEFGVKIGFNLLDEENKRNRNAIMFTNPKFPMSNCGCDPTKSYKFLSEPALSRGIVWPPS